MISGISTIYLSTELIYPDLPRFAIKKDQIRELYGKLHEPGGYPYENLDLQAGIPTLSTRRDNGQSSCQIGSGRIRITEDKPATAGITVDDFVSTVRTILEQLGPIAGPIVSQRCVVRCTGQPNNQSDSLFLLANGVANVLEPIDPFGRPPSFFGVRFRFAPMQIDPDEDAESKEGSASGEKKDIDDAKAAEPPKAKKKNKKKPVIHRGFINLRFETYNEDIKKVWMEADASYFEDIIEVGSLGPVEQNIRETSSFVTKNAKEFLDQFDTKEKEK
ncbi:MAG: hypothetical protein NTU53_15110 [Planctomycetota bacterium]|nr:hypothetical protein [Planctomycetota bacterium]